MCTPENPERSSEDIARLLRHYMSCVDSCTKTLRGRGYQVFLTQGHGNAPYSVSIIKRIEL